MNFSIHLPNHLLQELDQHVKSGGESRSAVVRDAVQQYLERFRASRWPQTLVAHMQSGLQAATHVEDSAGHQGTEPDFDAIRRAMNASMQTTPSIQQPTAKASGAKPAKKRA